MGCVHEAGLDALAEAVVKQAATDATDSRYREEAQALLADLLSGLGRQAPTTLEGE